MSFLINNCHALLIETHEQVWIHNPPRELNAVSANES
jgi:hypothetical protein